MIATLSVGTASSVTIKIACLEPTCNVSFINQTIESGNTKLLAVQLK